MDKLLKVLEAVNGRISSKELDAIVKSGKTDGEYEFSDDGLDVAIGQIQGLMTQDAAVHNPEIIEAINKVNYPLHAKTALTKVEEPLKELYKLTGVDFNGEGFISDKISDLQEKIRTLISEGGNKDQSVTLQTLNTELKEAKELQVQIQQDKDAEIKKLNEGFELERLRSEFDSKATEKTWASVYDDADIKGAILSRIWENINAKAVLKREEGVIKPYRKDDPNLPLYNGNSEATFQSLLEPEVDKYLKKSEPVSKPDPTIPKSEVKLTERQQQMIDQRKAYS